MRFRVLLPILIACALASSLAAQTKISGAFQCAKPDPVYSIPVGDRPDHVFAIFHSKCTWVKPIEIGGVQAKDHEFTAFRELSGNRFRGRSASMGTMTDGDRVFGLAQTSGTAKEGMTQTVEATWTYTGGTGKLRGIKGKGTAKAKAGADGTLTFEIEGEYQLSK